MGAFFICPVCHNRDDRYIGYVGDVPYCRLCVSFVGERAVDHAYHAHKVDVRLDYRLSSPQKEIAAKLLDSYKEGKNTMLHAVTGAGKTEMVLGVIRHVLRKGGKVGFAIPRREVVKELHIRFRHIFPSEEIIAVYGGNNGKIEGNFIIFTTHQAYRYTHYFDLLIVDEIDAFPYKDNAHLKEIVMNTGKGNHILMSATPKEKDEEEIGKDNIFRLRKRYHNHPLPVPKIIRTDVISQRDFLIAKIRYYRRKKMPLLVFAPTIKGGRSLYALLRIFCPGGSFVHAGHPKKNILVEDFRTGKLSYLVTTSILERGVTIENLQVIIYRADHRIYGDDTLIQIAGRVGRKASSPDGDVYFLCRHLTEAVTKAVSTIEEDNGPLP